MICLQANFSTSRRERLYVLGRLGRFPTGRAKGQIHDFAISFNELGLNLLLRSVVTMLRCNDLIPEGNLRAAEMN
ncbi:MAG: hypothetical protein GXP40_08915 [Chloroflexi bacterium]|nr:hypothetical protein [Chloroflexota bacterium]